MRQRRLVGHDGGLERMASPFEISCSCECWASDGDGLAVMYVAAAGLAEVDIDGGSNPVAKHVQVRRFLLLARTDLNVVLKKAVPVAWDAPDGCVCVRRSGSLKGSPHCRTLVADVTSGCGGRSEVDAATNVSRCLCMRDEVHRRHVEVHETDVAAEKRAGILEVGQCGDGAHLNVRRSMSGHRLARCSRIMRLGRDSPGLRLRMETTRASLLWQAAAVRPEPEKECLGCSPRLPRGICIACVYDFFRLLLG